MYPLLLIFWIIFNGQFTLEIFLFGIVICAAVFYFICKFVDYSIAKEIRLYRRSLFLIKYLYILFIEIIKANISTLKLMLSVKNEIEPVLVKFKSPLKTDFAKVLLANSITMTPGTITVFLKDEEYIVHCLDKDMMEGLVDGIFVEELKKIDN